MNREISINEATNDPRYLENIPVDASMNCRAIAAVFFMIDDFTKAEQSLHFPLEVVIAINETSKQLTPIDYEHLGYFVANVAGLYNPNTDSAATLHRLGMGHVRLLREALARKMGGSISIH